MILQSFIIDVVINIRVNYIVIEFDKNHFFNNFPQFNSQEQGHTSNQRIQISKSS